MAASDHYWGEDNGDGNGADPPVGCIDPVARRGVRTSLEETKRVSDGLFEMHGTIAGVETRLTERIAILADALGINDIRKRFKKADDARARAQVQEQAAALASIPPVREKTPSEMDRLETAARDFRQGIERISSHDLLPGQKTPSDPALARKVFRGSVILAWRGLRDGVKDAIVEHWVHVMIALAFSGASGCGVHFAHVWHLLK